MFPSHRLRDFSLLAAADVEALRTLGGPPVALPRHSIIRSEGATDRSAYLLVDGWVSSSMLLAGGERQILKLHLPGDMLGSTGMCLDHAIDTLAALTPVIVRKVPLAALGQLMAKSPRMAMFMLLSAQKERVALMDRVASNSRTSPTARMAFLLLDLHQRLSAIGQADHDSFEIAITQEQLGDIVGLTSVHVNRVLREMEREDLIQRHRRRVWIVDFDHFRTVARIPRRDMSVDPSWRILDTPDEDAQRQGPASSTASTAA